MKDEKIFIGPNFSGLFSKVYGLPYDFRFKKVGVKTAGFIKNILDEENLNPRVYSAFQTHSNNSRIVFLDRDHPFTYGRIFLDTDSIVTDKSGVMLLIKFADCTPIVYFDEKKKILGSAHSGWRGTVSGVSKSTIENMIRLGSEISDIKCYIGPSIGKSNYEVGRDVYDAFSILDEKDIMSAFKNSKTKKDKFYLDMKLANFLILKSLGIKEENIEVSSEVTFGNENLHSARESGENYGLNAILSMII